MTFCLITPRLPPAIDGIGDYCRQLMENLGKIQAATGGRQCPWTYLVHDGAERSRVLFPQVKFECLEKSPETLVSQLEALQVETVLLQYVGYGYANNGAPLFLADGLKQWRSRNPNRRLIIMFHEVYSQGMPWQRVFWQVTEQKQAVSELLDAASLVVTSMQPNADSIKVLRPHIAIKIIPIGSSFSASPSKDKNWRQLLIFGKQYARLRALKTHKQLLKQMSNEGLLDSVVLAGECTDAAGDQAEKLIKSWNLPVKIAACYNFPADNIPDAISTCGLSLMHTQSSNLLKSTSFQLAAQLGQVAITSKEQEIEAPFVAGRHYLWYAGANITELLDNLKDVAFLEKISQSILKAGEDNLSWQHIAQSWWQILQPT